MLFFSRQIILFGLIIFIAACFPNPAHTQQPKLFLNTAFIGPVHHIFDSLMKKTFEPIGFDVVVKNPPAERALFLANAGIDDGDGPRIAGLSRLYPNLIQISEKIIDVEFVGFSKKNIRIKNWQSLKPYRIGIIIGWKILEKNILNTVSLNKVKDAQTLFELLEKKRVDIIVLNRMDGLAVIKEKQLENIKLLRPALESKEMFLYLHKKHEKLIPQIETRLKELKKDGTYKKILDQVLKN